MAAPLNPTSFDLRPLPSQHPRLRLIEGGRSEAALARQRVFRRRRVAAAVLACIVVLVGVRLVSLAAASIDRSDATVLTAASAPASPGAGAAPTAAPADAPSPSPSYVVRRGDTLWSIAASIGGDADPRELVDALSERTGGRALQPGQRIEIAGLPGLDG